LGEKIVALGGHPSVKIQEIYEPGEQTIEEMLQEDVNSERMHLNLYEEQLETVMQDNTPLRLMFEQMISDEAQHLEQLEMYLRENTTTKAKAKV
jgi:bacterioferritin